MEGKRRMFAFTHKFTALDSAVQFCGVIASLKFSMMSNILI